MKFNLHKWKKIKVDNSHTTLRNDKGHELKIKHGALSPKLRADLAALPSAMADGGEAENNAEAMNAPEDSMGRNPMIQNTVDKSQPVGAPVEEQAPTDLQSAIRAAYEKHIQPLIDQNIQQFAQKKQNAADSSQILMDRIRMEAKPELQGPRVGSDLLPAEKEYAQRALDSTLAMGTIGSKSGGYMKNYTTSEQIENAISKGEGLAAKRTKAIEELGKANKRNSPEVQQAINDANQQALKRKITPGEGYSDGGEVNKKNAAELEKGASESKPANFSYLQNLKEGLGMADGGKVTRQNYAGGTPDELVAPADAPEDSMGRSPMTQVSDESQQEPSRAPAAAQGPSTVIINNGQQPQGQQAPQMVQPAQMQLAGPAVMPKPVMAPQASASDDYMGQMQKGYGLQNQAIGEKEAADTAIGQAAAILQGKQAKEAEDLYKKNRTAMENAIADNTAFMKDVRDGHITPQGIFQGKTIPGQVMTAIGLLLSGIGSGITKGPNLAMEVINKQIDRDMEAQRANLGMKQNLLSHNINFMNSMEDGLAKTRMQLNDYYSHLIDQAANQNKGAQAKAAADAARGELLQKNAFIASGLGKGPSLETGQNVDPDHAMQEHLQMMRMINPERAKEIESRYLPGSGIAAIPVPQETRNVITERKVLGDNIGKLMQFQQKYGGTLEGIADPNIRAYGEALVKQVQDQYRRANQQGVFKPAEAEFVNGVIADSPSSLFSKYTKLPAYKAAAMINQGNLQAAYNSIGLKPYRGTMVESAGSFTPKTFKPSR